MQIFEAMQIINSFSKLGKPVADLSRFQILMDKLGNPQDKLKFVHVAGTNGKGSTVRILSEMLTHANYRTGEFTSPFIYKYNDRIKVDGINIPDRDLCMILEEILPALQNSKDDYSQFEVTTAIAFIYFSYMKCDIVVLETGIGGLLDCTNIIKNPVVSVITSISLDHTKILGDTIGQIAKHKAGIIKQGCPAVLAPHNSYEVKSIIYQTSALNSSYFCTPNLDRLKIEKSDCTGNRFVYKNYTYNTGMIGKHQIENALTAIETADIIKRSGFENLNFVNIYEGIRSAMLPSRCQILREKDPLVIVDGAHNPDGMRTLAEFVKTLPHHPKIFVCGMLKDKDWQNAVAHISPLIDRAICVDGFVSNTVFAPTLAQQFRDSETSSLDNAMFRAINLAGKGGLVIVGGSLYLSSVIIK